MVHRRPMARVVVAFLACGALLITACDGGTIVDDWGPSAGHTLVEGRVLTSSRAPVDAGMEVSISRCGDPIGGFAGRGSTGANGHYSVRGDLPPVGALPALPDSLVITCEVIAGRGFAESGPVGLVFFTRSPPSPLRLDLVETPGS